MNTRPLLALLLSLALAPACMPASTVPEPFDCSTLPKGLPQISGDTVATGTGLKYVVFREGTGNAAVEGSFVSVGYTVYLPDERRLESSKLQFTIGETNLIAGFQQGILGMREGERRRLFVPAQLAYGDRENGCIPANSDLIFDVELQSAIGSE